MVLLHCSLAEVAAFISPRHPRSSPALFMQRFALMGKPSVAHFGCSGAETLGFPPSMDSSHDGAHQETMECSSCFVFQLRHGEKRDQLFAL